MGTTIDNIQIEIQSSSTNAAKGIDDLASSLERLKSNGAFKSVSTNLNHLSTALKNLPNVHNASNSLRTLANSIEKLKSVGTVSGLTNSLSKLPTALKSLDNINLERAAPQIQKVVDALGPLSSMKSGGIGTMVNSLKNLDKVTESLSEESITKFAAKIKELDTHLGPLSQKMTTIQAGLKGLNASFKQTSVAVDNVNAKVKVNMFNLANLTTVFSAVSGALQTLIQKFSNAVHQASQWDGVEYQFGNAFGEQADLYYEKITMITDALKLDKQMFMENSAMATSMLTGFGVNNVDARKMGLGYTELAYDIWAAYNNVYQSFDGADGVMAAIRSAIAGEVEPIRRAGFTIVESTLEQTAANHGLEISIEKATEAQKSYLRYLSLVDQAQSKGVIGTYASEMKTAEGMMRTFSQQVSSLTRAFGSLFIPVLVKVMPYVQAFVELLEEGVHWLAGLLGVEIQKVDFSDYKTGKDAVEGVGNAAGTTADQLGAATKAAKELKNATLGIDELNVISPTSATGGSGSSSGGGAGSDGFAGLDVDSLWDKTIFDTIQSDVDTIKEKLRGWMPVIATLTTALAGLRLYNLIKDLEIIGKTAGVFTAMGGALKGVKEFFAAAKQMAPEVGWLAALFPKLSGWFASIGTAISGAATSVGAFLAGISAPVWATIAAVIVAIGSAAYFLYENWEQVTNAAKNFFNENIAPKLENIKKSWDEITDSVKEAGQAIWNALPEGFREWLANAAKWIRDVVSAIGEWFGSVDWLKEIGNAVEWLGGIVYAIVGGTIAGSFQAVIGIVEGFAKAISGIIKIVSEVVQGVVALFQGDWKEAWNSVLDMGKGIQDVFSGLDEVLSGWLVNFTDGFTGFVKSLANEFDIPMPDIKGKLSSAWSSAKSWWDNKKAALKSYTPSIGSIYEKVKERWDSARTWWNNKKSAMKTYTPSIGSIYEKVSERWKNARDWWNGKKGSFKSYTPSIGSITDKVKSAWNSAKSWWNKNVKLSTKLDIKVPKIKVNWETASAFGKSFKYPTGFKLEFAKDGGVFDAGSLIWAGEHGAEIVANAAGGKTGVMNVQQMQDAVYEGVYAAFTAVMRNYGGNGGAQSVNVYLDSKQITSAVEKRQRERGASILGNEVYSY